VCRPTSCPGFAQPGNEKASPAEAVLTLHNAVKSIDQLALNAIFGSNAGEFSHTGNEFADKNMTAEFIRRYDQIHRVVVPDQTVRSVAMRTTPSKFSTR